MASIPAVKELERRYGARGLRVVSIAREEDRALVQRAMQQHGMRYPCYLDASGQWSRSVGIDAVPAFLLVDGKGRLAYRHVGKLSESGSAFDEMRGILDRVLAKR